MIYTLLRKDAGNSVDAVISFDSVSSSDESWSATVTTQTVEKGFNITDNVNIEPPTYSIEAVISSYSLFNLDNEIVWDGETFKNSGESNANSHIKARDEIIRIFKERSVLSLVESTSNSSNENLGERYTELQAGHYKEIDNCVMTSLSISHPDSGTGAFYVSIKLQKIHIALVTVSELQGDEVTPLVKPLQVNVGDKASRASTSEAGGTGGGGTASGEESTEGAEKDEDYTGLDWHEEYAAKRLSIKPMLDERTALEEMFKREALTGEVCKVYAVSGGWNGSCSSTQD